MKRIPLRSPDRNDTIHLEDELEKLQIALKVMVDSNRALEIGDDMALTRFGFDIDRIHELKERYLAGKSGFPDYVIRNLSQTIQQLRDCRQTMVQIRSNKVGDTD